MVIIVIFTAHIFHVSKELIIYASMIVILYIIDMLVMDLDFKDVTLRMLRYVFYITYLALFSIDYFDIFYGEKLYRYISVISSVFILIQLLVYKILGHYIPGFLTFLPLIREELLWHYMNYENRFIYDPRPRSFFSEPQIFATFVLGYLAILLFKDKWTKKDKMVIVILCVGIIVSMSTTAIIGLAFIWLIFLIKIIIRKKVSVFVAFLLVVAALLMFIIPVMYSERLHLGSHSVTGRLGIYSVFWGSKSDFLNLMIGHGMVDIDTSSLPGYLGFIPSLFRIYYYYGVIGCAVLTMIFIRLYRKINLKYKYLLLLVVMLMIGTVDFFGIMIFVSIPFIISSSSHNLMEEGTL